MQQDIKLGEEIHRGYVLQQQLGSPDWNGSSGGRKMKNLEKRIESLESMVSEMNVALARLSAEVLSFKSSPPPMSLSSPIRSSKGNSFLNPSSRDEQNQMFSKPQHKQQQHDLQEETIIDSYNFHEKPSPLSDQSSNKSFASSPPSSSSSGSSSPSSLHSKEPLHKIPFYRGERDAAVIWSWLDKVENYFKLGQATEDEKVLIATYHLKDAAYYWWKNQSPVRETTTSWNDFFKLFLKTFMPASYLREAKFALMDLRQFQSVAEYSNKFIRLVCRLPGLSEEDKVAYYEHGLKCNVRMDVDAHNPRTLDEAIRIAEASEARKYGWKSQEQTCN